MEKVVVQSPLATIRFEWIALLLAVTGFIILAIAAYRGLLAQIKANKLETDKQQAEGLAVLQEGLRASLTQLGSEMSRLMEVYRQTVERSNQQILESIRFIQEDQESRLDKMGSAVDLRLDKMGNTMEHQLDKLSGVLDGQLEKLSTRMDGRLAQMQSTVDEKLHKTLEERIGQSFQLVSTRLEQVYKGLGEMQTLAVGVGDLKKVLSNVKTRGVLGEYQLGAILEQILSPEQYAANVATKKDSRETVEYAVRLPGAGDETVWLPIDAKFPADCYTQLLDAYDRGDNQEIAAAATALEQRIRRFAKEVRDKYIEAPYTTDFAILFLPFEGLYAEVVRRGLVENLQQNYRVNIAGPTTLAALLNSLQMGFKTLAIQKRSGEVWQVLGAVKTEFDKFREALELTQQRLDQANRELDKLVGVRTRQIQRRLSEVASLPDDEAQEVLDID